MKLPRLRGRRLLLLALALLVLAFGVPFLLATVGSRHSGAARAAVFRFAVTTTLSLPARREAPLTRPPPPAFLLAAARRSAAFLADPRPTAAYWLLAPHQHEAVRLAMNGASAPGEQPVYVLAMVGRFTAHIDPPSGRSGLAHERVAISIFDASSDRELAGGGSQRLPDLARLGAVHDLRPYLLAAPLMPFLLGLDPNDVGRVLAKAGFAPLQIAGVPRSAYRRYVITKQDPAFASLLAASAVVQLVFTCRYGSGISPSCSG